MHAETENKPAVLVVGAGAAGLIAAWRAASLGARVVVLEKSARPGMKILISGGGKCNLTHAGGVEDILRAFRRDEALFLKPALYRFTNDDFVALMRDAGVTTFTRDDGRIFPTDNLNAKDVVAALLDRVKRSGATIAEGVAVSAIETRNGTVTGVRASDRLFEASRVIVAAGGASYPATGTTGDGWRWAKALGHTVRPLRAALAPLYLERPRAEWSGISLRDVVLRARSGAGQKEYAHWRGDLLFTHKGLSGPCALGISREVAEQMAAGVPGGGIVEVDIAPDHAFEALRDELREAARSQPRKAVSGLLAGRAPERIEAALWAASGLDERTRGANLSARDLNRLVSVLKGWSLGPVRATPLDRGEVVAGGVDRAEVDPKTMRSRIVDGLWLCGEILDVAGPVGGYNLQAAWSTGYVAGESAASV